MKLYYAAGACSLVVRIILNEIKVPFDNVAVNLQTKKTQHDADFREINPKGSVPVIELENGEILTENAVILQYLANTYNKEDLLPSAHNFNHYRILEWLNFITTELHKGFSPLFNPKVPQEVKEKIFVPQLLNKFTYINNHLQNNKYLCTKDFTLPDAYLYVMIRWALTYKLRLHECDNLAQYYTMLTQKTAIQDALVQEKLAIIAFDMQ